jgi:hypothetical protein
MARANGINSHLAGEYFVATSDEARKKVKQYATRGIVNLTSVRSVEFIERWDKIEAGLTELGVGKRRRGSA